MRPFSQRFSQRADSTSASCFRSWRSLCDDSVDNFITRPSSARSLILHGDFEKSRADTPDLPENFSGEDDFDIELLCTATVPFKLSGAFSRSAARCLKGTHQSRGQPPVPLNPYMRDPYGRGSHVPSPNPVREFSGAESSVTGAVLQIRGFGESSRHYQHTLNIPS